MTTDHDPPRLRALKGELPRDLTAALRDAPEDDPTPAELARLAQRLRVRFTESAPRAGARSPARRPGRGPVAAIVLTFALGAGAASWRRRRFFSG